MAQQSLGLSSAEAASLLRGCLANVYSMRGKAARDNWLWISVIVRLTTLILLLQILGSLIFSLPIISLMVIETCLIIWFKCIALSEVGLRARHLSEKISTSMNYTSGAEPPSDAIRLVHCYRDGKLVVLPEILLVVGDVVLLDQDQQQSEIGEFCTLFDSEKSINNDFESSDLKFPTLSPPSRYKIKICPLSVQLDCLSLGLSLNLRNGFLGGVSSHSLTIVFHLLTLISNYLIGKPSMARSSAICIAIIHSPLWFIFMLAYCNARLLVLFEMHARDACESKTSVFVEADESEIDEFDEAAPPPTRHVNIYFSQIFLKFLSNMIPSTKFRAYNLFWSFDYADALGTVSVMSFLDREGPIAVPFPLPTEIILPEKKDSDDGALSLTIVELITNVADPLTTRMRLPDGGTDRLRLFKRSIKALSLGMTFLTQNPDINACINRPNEWHLRIPWYNQMGSQFNKKHCPAISTCLCHFGRYLGISTNTINRYLPFCVTSSIDPCIIEHEKSMAMSNALKKFNSCLKSPRILVSEVDPTGSVTFGIGSLSEVANIIGYYWDGNTSKIVKITKGIKKRLFDIGNRSLSSDIQCLGIFLDPQSSNVHDIKDSVPSMASETGNNNGSGHDFEKHSENGSPHSFEKEEKILTNNRIPITRLKRGSIFLGAVCCEYLPKQHMQELIDDLENCGIRWVYFSPLDEVATKAFGDRCGLETEWNSCIVLGERSSFKNGPPTGTEVDTKAKLPRGISNVRPHLQIVDDIPLHISLFSNCDSRSTSEMMEVYEEWGEVVVAVRSALNWTTIQTSLHSRLSISMTSRDSTDLNLLNFTDYKFLDSFNNPRIKRALVEKVSVPLFHTYALFIALTFSFSELLSYFLSWFPEFKHRFLYHNGFVDTSTSDCIENEKFASDGSNQSNFPMFFPENNSGNPDKVQCSLTLATAIGCIGSPMAGLPFDSNPYLLTELIREGRRLEGGRRNGLRCMWSYFILSIFIFIDTKISVGEIYVTCIFVSLLSMTCVMNGPVESGMMRMMPFSKPLHTGMTPVFLDTIPVIIHELSMYLLRILLSIFSWYSASLLCGIELRTLRSLFTLGFCATMMHTTHSVLIFGPIQNPLWSVVATLFFVTSFRGTLWNIGFISTLIYTLLTLGITNEGVKSFWWRPEVDRMQRRARLHFNTKLGYVIVRATIRETMDPERQVRYLASDERNIVNGSSKNMYKVNEYEKYVQEKIQIAPKILGTVERRLVRDRYDPDTTGLGKTSRRRGDRTILFDWRPEDDTSYSYSEISHDRSTVKLNDMFVKTNHVEIGGRRSGAIHDSKYESKHRGRFDVRNYVDRDDSLGEFQNEKNKGKRLDDEETKKSRQVEVITVDAYGNESVVVVKKKNSDEFGAQGSLDAPKERLPVWELKCLEEMTDRDWRIMREDLNIAVTGLKCAHHPLRHWSDYLSQISKSKSSSLKSSTLSVDNRTKIPQSILHVIKDLGYKNPTPIQRQAIPIIYDGYDVIGIAETGSGKTAAFIIPMLMRMLNQPSHTESNYSHKLESQFGGTMKNVRPQKKRDNEESNRGPYGIVLAPTRELAQQIEHEANRFCRPLGLESIAIVGGHSIGQQEIKMMMRTLERGGVDLIVATPGRLRDCIEQHVITLSSCKMVILDEADRMIHLNYEEDLRFILASTPKSDNLLTQNTGISDTNVSNNLNNTDTEDVQMIMFSATMPSGLQGLAKSFLTKPLTIMIGDTGISALSVEQRVEIINSPAEKDKRLIQLLSSGIYSPPIVVFVNLKTTVDYVTKKLEAAGLRCVGLHGGKSQEQRETSVAQVRSSSRDILVATDVAGRGLDIKDVSLVVNYNMSPTIEEYVHRVGRTGRMGKTGTAITFLSTESDGPLFYDLATMLRRLPADKRLANDLLEHEFASSRLAHTFVANVTGKNKKGSGSRIKGEEKIFAYGL